MGDAIKEAVVKLTVEQDVARIKAPSTDPITKWKNAQTIAHRDVVRSAVAAEKTIQRELDRTAAKLERNIALYGAMGRAAAAAGGVGMPGPTSRRRGGGRRSGIVGGLVDLGVGIGGGGFGGFGGFGGGMLGDYVGGMSNREYARTMGRMRTAGRFALGSLMTPAMGAIAGVGAAAISAAYIVNREATAGLDDWNRRNMWRPEGAEVPAVMSRPSSRAAAMLGRFRAPAGRQFVGNSADNDRLRRMYGAISDRELGRDELMRVAMQDARAAAFSGYGATGGQRYRAAVRANRRLMAAAIDPSRLAFEQSERGDGSGFADRHMQRVESQIALRQAILRGVDTASGDAQSRYTEGVAGLAARERGVIGAARNYDAANAAYKRERALVRGAEASIGGVGNREEFELKRLLGRVRGGKSLTTGELGMLNSIAGQDDRVAAYVEKERRRQFEKRGFGDALDKAFGTEHKGLASARRERDAAKGQVDEATGGKGVEAALEDIKRQRAAMADELEKTFAELTKIARDTLSELRQLENQHETLSQGLRQ